MYKPVVPAGCVLSGQAILCTTPVGKPAAALLPYTGIAFGTYLAIAITLMIAGMVMSRSAKRKAHKA